MCSNIHCPNGEDLCMGFLIAGKAIKVQRRHLSCSDLFISSFSPPPLCSSFVLSSLVSFIFYRLWYYNRHTLPAMPRLRRATNTPHGRCHFRRTPLQGIWKSRALVLDLVTTILLFIQVPLRLSVVAQALALLIRVNHSRLFLP